MSWRRLENIFQTSLRCPEDVLKMFTQEVLKTSSGCLEDTLETCWRHLEHVWLRCRPFEDVLKTPSKDVWPRRINSAWARSLEEAVAKVPTAIFNRLGNQGFLVVCKNVSNQNAKSHSIKFCGPFVRRNSLIFLRQRRLRLV